MTFFGEASWSRTLAPAQATIRPSETETGESLSSEGSSTGPGPEPSRFGPVETGGAFLVEPEGAGAQPAPRPAWDGGLGTSARRMMGIGRSLEGPSATLSSEGLHLTTNRVPVTREGAHICLKGPTR